MALARVQATGKVKVNAVNAVTLTFAAPPTVGNGVIVLVSYKFTGGAITLTCSDNRGNSYTLAKLEVGSGSVRSAIFVCAAVTTSAAPFTITVAFASSTGSWIASAVEVSGGGSGLVVDQTASSSGVSGTAVTTGTTAALTADEVLLVAVMASNITQASITVVVATPVWTQEYEDLTGSLSVAVGEGDTRLVTGMLGATATCSWTQASSTAWTAALAAFKPFAAAVATADSYVWGPL